MRSSCFCFRLGGALLCGLDQWFTEDVWAKRNRLPLPPLGYCVLITPGADCLLRCSEERRHLNISGQAKSLFDLPLRDIHGGSKSLLTGNRQPLFTAFSQCLLT